MISSFSLACLLSSALTFDALTVGPNPEADFASIQEAIDAASDGDEIRIAAGSYGAADIQAKSLTLTGGTGVVLDGTISVSNLAAGQDVVLRHLEARPVTAKGAGLHVAACQGLVLVEHCILTGLSADGLYMEASELLVVNESEVISTLGSSSNITGTAGLRGDIASNALALHEVLARGAQGMTACDGFPGGSGIAIGNAAAQVNGLNTQGGRGGYASCCPGWGGSGGTGIRVGANCSLVFADITAFGGGGGSGCPGGLVTTGLDGSRGDRSRLLPGSTVVEIDTGPRLNAPTTFIAGDPVQITATRVAGDDVWVLISSSAASSLDLTPGQEGMTLANFTGPLFSGSEWHFLGQTQPVTGDLSVGLAVPPSAISADGRIYVQSVHVEGTTGDIYYGPLRVLHRAPEIGTPFCFGDGADPMGCNDCPCGNEVAPGSPVGCRNGTGQGCRLFARGTTSVASGDLRFDVEGVNPNTAALLSSATQMLPLNGLCAPGTGIPAPTLDGLRCIGGNKLRHGIRSTNSQFENNVAWGTPNPPAGIAGAAGFQAGETRHFQVSYREDPLLGCGQAIQLSNAVQITFTP